ncbi:ribonuclease Y [Desulfohalobium retbaense]|uniref:Ribonuclease Y n=1 Tax=Desulfohalobium retbaense (strain ATCC 49708 / DSM 5692 / JCM 16813 / HR100) TaxID=485915 RepID=C8X4Z4_DESRD|nr:ribonuclease Y [Desulfohalobium retbaense]ACV69491.1 metal dependent phosphohydrolase [Desulfohalobium retbaense DSM 5692]
MIQYIAVALIGALVGTAAGVVLNKKIAAKKLQDANVLAERILDESRKEAQAEKKEYLLQAQDDIYRQKKEMEQELKERESTLKKQELRLQEKEERLQSKQESNNQKESEIVVWEKRLTKQERDLEERQQQLDEIIQQQEKKLEQIAGLTAEEAKKRLLADIESKTRHEAAATIRQIEMEAKENADRKAREILATAIQRYAGDYVSEHTVTAVELPSEDMKGRIIGREGRNIRAIEAATGVDLIIDDTPETVVLSAFSPLRREIAKRALERLISDGRIHPARIEDMVKKVEQEMEVKLREIGEQATFDVGVHGIHPELVRLLGHLHYRTSFSQNVLHHSLDVAFLCGIMAAELGLDVKKAKRAGLLHDLGKAVDHEVEGPHAVIGADLAKKYNESEEIVHAISAHHEDVPPKSVLDVLVQAADSLSGARPGARKELLQNYVKRLEELEGVASGFDGVSKAYAIQAGRELRVVVDCERLGDDSTYLLCKDIAKQVEEKLTYPGQIKVTCIRERRAVEIAK